MMNKMLFIILLDRKSLVNDFFAIYHFLFRSELAEREGMLRTKAMRQREDMKERRKYRFCLIRIRFPNGLVLQVSGILSFNYLKRSEFGQDFLVSIHVSDTFWLLVSN